jgi:hypothetical protein
VCAISHNIHTLIRTNMHNGGYPQSLYCIRLVKQNGEERYDTSRLHALTNALHVPVAVKQHLKLLSVLMNYKHFHRTYIMCNTPTAVTQVLAVFPHSSVRTRMRMFHRTARNKVWGLYSATQLTTHTLHPTPNTPVSKNLHILFRYCALSLGSLHRGRQ